MPSILSLGTSMILFHGTLIFARDFTAKVQRAIESGVVHHVTEAEIVELMHTMPGAFPRELFDTRVKKEFEQEPESKVKDGPDQEVKAEPNDEPEKEIKEDEVSRAGGGRKKRKRLGKRARAAARATV